MKQNQTLKKHKKSVRAKIKITKEKSIKKFYERLKYSKIY